MINSFALRRRVRPSQETSSTPEEKATGRLRFGSNFGRRLYCAAGRHARSKHSIECLTIFISLPNKDISDSPCQADHCIEKAGLILCYAAGMACICGPFEDAPEGVASFPRLESEADSVVAGLRVLK